jgi:DNA-binding response OmpR family regulator
LGEDAFGLNLYREEEEIMGNDVKRILVIDDDHDLVESTSALLRAQGFEVSGAYAAEEGKKAIQDFRPHLIVLDIMMETDSAGFDLAYALRKNIPIVIVSSFQEHLAEKMDAFQHVLGRDWPAASLLEKPVDPSKLTSIINQLLA